MANPLAGWALAALILVHAANVTAQAPAVVETEPAQAGVPAGGDAEPAPQKVEIAEGAFVLTAPGAWTETEPRNRIIERELSVPAPVSEGAAPSAEPARLTLMSAGGSVEQNTARWIGQFRGTAGGAAREKAAIDELEADGAKITVVDVSGTYLDMPRGPFGPSEEHEGYRLVGAIFELPDNGLYFAKLIGPAAVVGPAKEAFLEMARSVEKNSKKTP